MRYLRATFINYIGFYNGLGLTKVDIDFSKSTHNIVLIVGENGSGKSTLLNHLNPFPDGSTSFIPNKTAEKILILFHQGDTYEIHITSPADLKGRKTTKAYIRKNGTELNENGNVTSYKDIIFSEFEMDSNYISLSRLSSVDRGIGDKTPAERKKFVSSIIDNLEIYNSIYKTLNKKSLIYKSHVNTLHTKIQNIGDRTVIDLRLQGLIQQKDQYNMLIEDLNKEVVALQVMNTISPEEAKVIQDITNNAQIYKKQLEALETQLDLFYNKTKIKREEITEKYNSDITLKDTYTTTLNDITSKWKDKSDRLSKVSSDILDMEAQMSSINTDDTITSRYSNSNNLISSYITELSKLQKVELSNSIEILPIFISACDKLCEMIDRFYDNLNSDDISRLVNNNILEDMSILRESQNDISLHIQSLNEKISEYNGQMKLLATLENRPKKCTIDSCPFISEGVKLKKNLKVDIPEEINALQEAILNLSAKSSKIEEELLHINSILPKTMELDSIRKVFIEYNELFSIFYPDILANYNTMLANINNFNEIREHKVVIDYLNISKKLDSEKNNNLILKAEYDAFKEKIQIINGNRALIEKLKAEQSDLSKDVASLKFDIDKYNETIKNILENISNETMYADAYNNYLIIKESYDNTQIELQKYNDKSAKALESITEINNLQLQIDFYKNNLIPIEKEISTINGQLTLLESYYQEYNMYKSSYDTIETLKKYCNPTGGGIQTIFMQLYMSKTVSVSNQILSMLFNGSYKILDFIINESEFRIPFVGEGLPVDDISSGSNSQISMMSMIINLVLLHQGSSKFNIAQLDEIDGSLSHTNRANFVNILFHCMNILELEQVFLISHSIEVDNTFADIIRLKDNSFESGGIASGNIIWDYKDQIDF